MLPWILLGVVSIILVIVIWLRPRPHTAPDKSLDALKSQYEHQKKTLELDFQHRKAALEVAFLSEKAMFDKQLNEISIAFGEDRKKLKAQYDDILLNSKNKYEEDKENLKLNYDNEFAKLAEAHNAAVEKLNSQIADLRGKAHAAIKIQEAQNANDPTYNTIVLSMTEKAELAELRALIAKLSNPTPFYKAVYEIYFRNKVVELCNRIVGLQRVSGVYKITHISNGRSYVGQSVDIKDRWIQHAKRGSGAETPTSNKLYPAMLKDGIESFRFEILETTKDTSQLGKMEKYWQEFYKAIESGYSIR